MKRVLSFISNKIVYILIGIILVLSLIISIQYSLSLKKDNRIDSLNNQVTTLEEKNLILESSLKEMKYLREKEQEELDRVRNDLKTLQEVETNATKGIENVYKNKGVVDRPLDADVARMLNDVYESVHSNGKSNP